MPKRVLSVGQCVPDHSGISRFLRAQFGAQVEGVDTGPEALQKLRGERYDLVLINRKLDIDYSDGLPILETIKADPELAETPVMLVSNYADAQQQAVAAGAEYGFGKSEYGKPEVVERLNRFLSE